MMNLNRQRGFARIALLVVLVVLVGAVYYWQAPGSKLTPEEIESYLGRMQADLPMPEVERSEFIKRLRSWGNDDNGKPVHMLNLIRFNEQMPPVPGHPQFTGTAEEANAHYERVILPLLAERGVYPIFASVPHGLGPDMEAETNLLGFEPELGGWDRVLVVRYPSRRAFLDMASDPTYMKVVPFKLAAIDLGFVPLDKEYAIPDLRWLAAFMALAIYLTTLVPGWLRRR